MTKICIVIPVYNTEQYLSKCIDSILVQSMQDFLLILVNDGSTDRSRDICEDYANRDERIKVINKENGGAATARNVGIDWMLQNTDCPWITFVDSDDRIHPDYLSTLYNAVSDSSAQMAIAKIHHTTKNEDILWQDVTEQYTVMTPEGAFTNKEINTISPCAKLYNREIIGEIRYPEGKIHEDRFTTYRYLFACETVVYIPALLYLYVQNPSSVTHSVWTLKFATDNIEAVESQLRFFDEREIHSAWELTAKNYIDLLIMSTEAIKSRKAEYKNEYILLLKKLHRFVFRNWKRLRCWNFTGRIYSLTYPLLRPIYKNTHKGK